MINLTELKLQFQAFGVELTEEIADYCTSLCLNHDMDEKTLVETWMAYSLSDLGGAMPTLEYLQQLEKKQLLLTPTQTYISPKRSKPSTPVSVHNSSGKKRADTQHSNLNTTPSGKSKCQKWDSEGSFSPASFSPNALTPSSKYASRPNSRQTVMTYGESCCLWKADKSVSVDAVPYLEGTKPCDWKFMYETLRSTNIILQDVFEEISNFIITENGLELNSLNNTSSGVVIHSGRVVCEEIKLNANSIIVEGHYGKIEVDMSQLIEYSVFPGQIIVFEGRLTGKKITATKLYTSALLSQLDNGLSIKVPVQILVAAGPFTQLDTMSYEPLNDFLDYVTIHQPNLLFLIGPLLDANHDNIKNGDVAEHFSLYHSRLLHTISQQLPHTKVFYITSSKDVFNIPVYPTPPLVYSEGINKINKVTVLPDPSLLNINGCIVGITATDTLLHLGKKEISNGGNRLGRLVGHLLKQQNFYPLYPADPDVGLDLNQWNQHARLAVTPHLLIIPSGLHHFIKVVEGCVVINPERLTKGLVGGTFASIEVKPQEGDVKWTAASHISAHIIKI